MEQSRLTTKQQRSLRMITNHFRIIQEAFRDRDSKRLAQTLETINYVEMRNAIDDLIELHRDAYTILEEQE